MNNFSAHAPQARCGRPVLVVLIAMAITITCGLAQAQSATANSPSNVAAAKAADFIVAVVNSEPITNNEVQQLRAQLVAQGGAAASKSGTAEFTAKALEQLINEKIQLQSARESGIRVEDDALDQAEMNVARQNQLSKEQFHAKLKEEGLSVNAFRDQIRKQIMLSRLRDREVQSRVRINDTDIDQFLRDQRGGSQTPLSMDLNLAMILLPVPEDSTEAQVSVLQARAETAARRARAGEDFGSLVKEYMTDTVPNGGAMGLRSSERYPSLFVENTQNLNIGEIAGPIRSGAGFHVLKVLDKRQGEAAPIMVMQTRARHILLRSSPQQSEAAAQIKLSQLKQRLLSGQATFAALAKEYSEDGSASNGGDLGWVGAGQFVPEFEQVMNQLRPGQLSEPVVSRFGVHLIEVTERREVPLSAREQRDWARTQLREKRLEEAFTTWQEDLRGRAYVEMREPAQ